MKHFLRAASFGVASFSCFCSLNQSLHAQWAAFQECNGLAYFMFTSPPRIERYSITAQVWLAPIALPTTPTAFCADGDNVYVGLGQSAWKFDGDGGAAQHLADVSANVNAILSWNNLLYVVYSSFDQGRILSIDKASGAVITRAEGAFPMFLGASLSPTLGRLYGSPDTVSMLELRADGTFGQATTSPFIGGYLGMLQTFVFPGSDLVGDNVGTVYRGSDLSYQGSLGRSVESIAFRSDGTPVVLHGQTLFSYSATLRETGRFALDSQQALSISIHGDKVVVFDFASGRPGVRASLVPLASLVPPEPEPIPSWSGLALTPDGAFLDRDDTLYLVSREHRALFRWSARSREYMDGLSLADAPALVAYSPDTHRIYLAGEYGRLSEIKLAESLSERPFTVLPGRIQGLATAGEFIFVYHAIFAAGAYSLIDPEGTRLSYFDSANRSSEYVWSATERRMYLLTEDVSPRDLAFVGYSVAGEVNDLGDSPYHGEYEVRSPVRVRQDGGAAFVGPDHIYETHDLIHLRSLEIQVIDAAWVDSTLFTLRDSDGVSEIQRWSSNYTPIASTQLGGTPYRIWKVSEGLLVVTIERTRPRFTMLDSSLNVLFQSSLNFAPTGVVLEPSTMILNTLSPGAVAGILMARDPDADDSHEYTLLDSAGDRFRIEGHQLLVNARLIPYTTWPIIVRVTDAGGLSVDSAIEITVIEDLPPPPQGGITLKFESTGAARAKTNFLHESGFWIQSGPKPFLLVSASETNTIPHNGTGYLLHDEANQTLTIRHRLGEPFQMHSFRIAGTRPGPGAVIMTARMKDGYTSTFVAGFHGGVDGKGGLEDFQTYYSWFLGELEDLTLSGSGFALDDISIFVGSPLPTPRFWVQAVVPAAFEDPGLDLHGEPAVHDGLVGIWRLGDLSQFLTCQLSFGGTATYGADYSVVGYGYTNRALTFAPGQSTLLLTLLPTRDSVSDDRETVEVRIEPAPAYQVGTPDRAVVTVYEEPYDAWIVNRWWGIDPGSPYADPGADPDHNGYNNIAEFVLGVDDVLPTWMEKPRFYHQDGWMSIALRYSKLAPNCRYQLSSSRNLGNWTPLDIEPVVTPWSPTLDILYFTIPDIPSPSFIKVEINRAP